MSNVTHKRTLDELRHLFIEGLRENQTIGPPLSAKQKQLCAWQENQVLKSADITEFGEAVQISNSVHWRGFENANKNEDFKMGQALQVSFSRSPVVTQLFAAVTETAAFVLLVKKLEIAPPIVVQRMGWQPWEAVLWFVAGGYGIRKKADVDGYWIAIPTTIMNNVNYESWSITSFLLKASGSSPSSNLQSITLASTQPFNYSVSVQFNGPSNLGIDTPHLVEATWICQSAATIAVPQGCFECHNGRGTEMYCYPDTNVTLRINNTLGHIGRGWIEKRLSFYEPRQNIWDRGLASFKAPLFGITSVWVSFVDVQYEIILHGQIQSGNTYPCLCHTQNGSYDTTARITITASVETANMPDITTMTYPTGLQLVIRSPHSKQLLYFSCNEQFSYNVFINEAKQQTYIIVLDVQGTRAESGFAVIVSQDTLPLHTWADNVITDPDIIQLFKKQWRAQPWPLGVWTIIVPITLCIIATIAVVIISLKKRQRRLL